MSNHCNGEDTSVQETARDENKRFEDQAEHLAQHKKANEDEGTGATQAVEAKFITPLDPVIVTEDGGRLPIVPVEEAVKLNQLKEKAQGVQDLASNDESHEKSREPESSTERRQNDRADAPLRDATPPSR